MNQPAPLPSTPPIAFVNRMQRYVDAHPSCQLSAVDLATYAFAGIATLIASIANDWEQIVHHPLFIENYPLAWGMWGMCYEKEHYHHLINMEHWENSLLDCTVVEIPLQNEVLDVLRSVGTPESTWISALWKKQRFQARGAFNSKGKLLRLMGEFDYQIAMNHNGNLDPSVMDIADIMYHNNPIQWNPSTLLWVAMIRNPSLFEKLRTAFLDNQRERTLALERLRKLTDTEQHKLRKELILQQFPVLDNRTVGAINLEIILFVNKLLQELHDPNAHFWFYEWDRFIKDELEAIGLLLEKLVDQKIQTEFDGSKTVPPNSWHCWSKSEFPYVWRAIVKALHPHVHNATFKSSHIPALAYGVVDPWKAVVRRNKGKQPKYENDKMVIGDSCEIKTERFNNPSDALKGISDELKEMEGRLAFEVFSFLVQKGVELSMSKATPILTFRRGYRQFAETLGYSSKEGYTERYTVRQAQKIATILRFLHDAHFTFASGLTGQLISVLENRKRSDTHRIAINILGPLLPHFYKEFPIHEPQKRSLIPWTPLPPNPTSEHHHWWGPQSLCWIAVIVHMRMNLANYVNNGVLFDEQVIHLLSGETGLKTEHLRPLLSHWAEQKYLRSYGRDRYTLGEMVQDAHQLLLDGGKENSEVSTKPKCKK